MATTIATVIERAGLHMTCTRVNDRARPHDWPDNARHWRCTISRRRTGTHGATHAPRMIVMFTQGPGHSSQPTLPEVLDCIASDAATYTDARGFESWCSDYGYDTDSRKAFATWQAIQRQCAALDRLLRFAPEGGDMDTLLFNTERL